MKGLIRKYIIIINLAAGFTAGSVLIVLFSAFQKYIAGIPVFTPKAYIVPLLFGGITGVILTILIQREKTVKSSLKKSEERFKFALDAVKDGVWDIDIANNKLYFSENFYRLLGYDHLYTTFTAEKIFSLFHQEDRDEISKEYNNLINGSEKHFVKQVRIKKSNGKFIWILARGMLIDKNSQNKFTRAMGTITDITQIKAMEDLLKKRNKELKKANDQLNAANQEMEAMNEELLSTNERITGSEIKYRTILEQMNEIYFEIDTNWHIIFFNKTFVNTLGLNKNEIYGKNLKEFIAPDNLGKIKKFFNIITATQKGSGSLRAYFQTGSVGLRILELSAIPLMDQNYNMKGFRCIGRDISEQLKMEDEILKISKIESMSVFAGGIAHDFNNLLTGIIGHISIAELSINDREKLSVILKNAETAALKARDLTQQLLTFSKGGAPFKRLASLKNVLTETSSFIMSGSSLTAEYDISSDLYNAEIDAVQISQVIQNLVINAMQAINGNGTIRIAAKNIVIEHGDHSLPLQKGKYIKISVSDTGTGIQPDNLKKIFDPFFTTKSTGTGLGLSVCDKIIKNHGGHIVVSSELDVGTRFDIYLPASEKPILDTAPISKAILNGTGSILIVDDNESIMELGSSILKKMGYAVLLAKSGEEAVDIVKKTGVKIGIIDLILTGRMSGLETFKAIKEIEPAFKALITCVYANDQIMIDFNKYGICTSLKKPFSIKELSEGLSKIL